MSQEIFDRCVMARHAANLSQEQAAAALGFSVRTLRRYETYGGGNIDVYRAMADCYCCDLGWLVTGVGERIQSREMQALHSAYWSLPRRQRIEILRYMQALLSHIDNA